jgi:hypothetical protein
MANGRPDPISEIAGIVLFREQAGRAILNHFGERPGAASHGRRPAGKRFKHHTSEPLEPDRW